MKMPLMLLAIILAAVMANAVPPSFHDTAAPEGWSVTRGEAATGTVLQAKNAGSVQLQTTAPLSLPVEATFRFRAAIGDDITVQALSTDAKVTAPLLQSLFRLTGQNQAYTTAYASGAAMATTTISDRTWTVIDQKGGGLYYSWRYPKVKILWDQRDYQEIGAAYAQLAPFEEKVFTLRLVVTATSRQIWLDDRLVAEEQTASPPQVRFSLQLTKTLRVLSADFGTPVKAGAFLPLSLTAYSHARKAQQATPACALTQLPGKVPMWMAKSSSPDIDLGQSLYRYRLTHGSGPDAGYVNALVAWPAAFDVDPASLTFRVPYRNYQNVWLLAWLDEKPNTTPRGTLQFFREKAGYAARSDFEITPEAMRKGLVKKLAQKTPDGKSLYLVKVPLDTDGLYGLHDLADQFLDFELSKPVSLVRSYPDPIYYGYHPGGWPSAVHVAGITLEEAPFGYEVQPAQTEDVFEQPQKPSYTVAVTNTTDKPLTARVKLQTRSYDSTEKGGATGSITVAPRGTGMLKLEFDLKKLGWHELRVGVEANGQARGATLALVLLPPNTRTYGNAQNEVRFGIWELLGHYVPLRADPKSPINEKLLALFRQIGLRRFPPHESFVTTDLLKKYDLLPGGGHTVGNAFAKALNPDGTVNEVEMKKGVAGEVAPVVKIAKDISSQSYYYGGEWAISKEIQYAPWPRYTDEGDRELTPVEQTNAGNHVKIFSAIGKAIRASAPNAKLVLQWGAPSGSLAYLRAGMPKDLVDFFGMDAPQFELLPEVSNVTGSINDLWAFRQETQKMGWPRLPIAWCEGPFFPTNPGALTEDEQANYQIRYWLLGLAYGVEQFEAGVVPHDAGNYYGAEHYGAGLFHRRPLEHPKPAVAAVATATAMLCGADTIGGVDTGCLTTYCLGFQRAKDKSKIYALWRVNGDVDATIKVRGDKPVLTDAMGNATPCKVVNGAITVKITPSPAWLTGVEGIDGFTSTAPRYSDAPAHVTRPLAQMTADRWSFDASEDTLYATNHFAIRRIPDTNLKAEFGQGEKGHTDAMAVTLPVEKGDKPMATRYAQLKLKQPVVIPGKAKALGMWIKGNSGWGRVVYQCRDAKGEIWTSVGTRDDWNCDDTHAWSYVSFEGWRYVRFPLPGNQPYDGARDLEMTWWGSRDGDGIVDLPLTLEKIIVEARNEVPYLGEMKQIPERSYKLSGLVAEYDTEADATDAAIKANQIRKPLPEWSGPSENPIARLAADGTGAAPVIKEFIEPSHFNDGRQMVIRFDAQEGFTYNVYLSLYEDGRGADLLASNVKDGDQVRGLRPAMPLYLFLTAVGKDKKESKPSAAFKLITKDNFKEK